MATSETLQIHLTVRWWVAPYLRTLVFLCLAMGTQPNFERVQRLIYRRGFRIRRA